MLATEIVELVNGDELEKARVKLVSAVIGTDPRFNEKPTHGDDLHEAAWGL